MQNDFEIGDKVLISESPYSVELSHKLSYVSVLGKTGCITNKLVSGNWEVQLHRRWGIYPQSLIKLL